MNLRPAQPAAALRLSPLAGRGRSASAIRVRGSLREGGDNRFENASQVARYIVVPEAQNSKVAIGQPFVAHGVARTVRMLSAVDLNDQPSLAANEVDGVWPDWLLPDEFVTVQPARTKAIPERPFRIRQRGSQVPSARGLGFISTSHAEAPPHPPRFARRPLPARGERRKVHHT